MLVSLPKPALIRRVIKENSQVKTFILNQKIEAKPGQFLMLWLPRVEEKPFSIAEPDPLTLTVAKVGPFSNKLHRLRAGDKVWFRGPLGNSFKLKGEKIVLVAGGYGVAPLYFLAKEATSSKRKIIILIGAKNKKEVLFLKRFKKLRGKVIVATEDNSLGVNGKVIEPLTSILSKKKIDRVYACGPEGMLKEVVKICKKMKIRYQISMEAVMKCGLGICGSCSRNGRLICKDGPVFSFWLGQKKEK